MSPRPTGWDLLWIAGQKLRRSSTAFESIRELGDMGPVESPLAADDKGERVFRYRSAPPLGDDDRNEILSFASKGEPEGKTAFKLHPNRWIPWMLHYLEKDHCLLGLVSLGLPPTRGTGVRIEHRLGYFDLRDGRQRLFSLPPDCFTPLGINLGEGELLFHGVSGFQSVDLTGRQRWKHLIASIERPWGATPHPLNGGWLIGGAPLIHLSKTGESSSLISKEGLFPVWHPSGEELFLARSSGDLSLFHPPTGEWNSICSIAGNRHPEMKRGRPVRLSPDHRYFALPLTRRAPLGEGAAVRSWSEHQTLCVGDLERRELWQHPGPVSEIAWMRQNNPTASTGPH